MKCDREALDRDSLPPELEAHLVRCAACREELRWLRAERALMARRAANSPSALPLWRGIERRLAAPPRRSFGRLAWPAALAAALSAAAIVIAIGSQPPAVAPRSPSLPEPQSPPTVALSGQETHMTPRFFARRGDYNAPLHLMNVDFDEP